MNIRQQKYKKYRLEGMNKYASARKAGYSHGYAISGTRVEQRADMSDLLEMEGLTDRALAEHATEGLNASEEVRIEGLGAIVKKPNWSVRHKYFETILKLKNKLSDRPLIDLSKHEHKTVIFVRAERIDDSHTNRTENLNNTAR